MEELADVWPQGGLFAFSGVDGKARRDEPFVAAGLKQTIGWEFLLDPRLTFKVVAGRMPLVPWRSPGDFCFADCWRTTGRAGDDEGIVAGAYVTQHALGMLISFRQLPEEVYPDIEVSPAGRCDGRIEVFSGNGWHIALCRDGESLKRRFGMAISYASESEAVDRAVNACAADLVEVAQQRLHFYRTAPVPESMTGNIRRAYYKAVSVHKVHFATPCGDFPAAPGGMAHRRLWLWNAAFHALGLQYMSVEAAQDIMREVLDRQLPNGWLRPAAERHEGGADVRDAQPPLLAWSVCRQNERLIQTDFLAKAYPRLTRYLEWFERNRKNENGLYAWRMDGAAGRRGAESGMDNSPRFDNAQSITAVDLSSYMASEYHSMEKIARCLDRPDDAAMWQKRRLEIAESMNALLWDDETRFYYDLDEYAEFISVKTSAGFLPMLGQIPDRDRAEALRMHLMNPNEFWSPLPVCSVSQDEGSYSNDLWRGPTWMNINTLIYYGLMTYGFFQEARQLGRMTIQEIARCYMKHGCLYDCYDSLGNASPADLPRMDAPVGELLGVIQDAQWSASAMVYLANEMG